MDYFISGRPFFFNSLIFLTLLSSSMGNGDSAKEAIAVLKIQRGAAIVAGVTNVRGHRGQDQPLVWEVTSRISDGERVFVIKDEKIVADTIYSSGGGINVDLRRLQIDSVQVFQIANRAAVKADIGFDSIDYELRAAPLGNAPLWIIHLRDFRGRDVGKLEVSGESSEVLSNRWFEPRSISRQPIGPNDVDSKSVLKAYDPGLRADASLNSTDDGQVTSFARKTGEKLKRGLMSVGNGFNRIFGNQAEVSTGKSRRGSPSTLRRAPR